jgi:hypothetical protein
LPTGGPGGTGTIRLPDTGAGADGGSAETAILLTIASATIAIASTYWLLRHAGRRG